MLNKLFFRASRSVVVRSSKVLQIPTVLSGKDIEFASLPFEPTPPPQWRYVIENPSDSVNPLITSEPFIIVPSTDDTDDEEKKPNQTKNYRYPSITVRPNTFTINQIIDEEFPDTNTISTPSTPQDQTPIYLYTFSSSLLVLGILEYYFR